MVTLPSPSKVGSRSPGAACASPDSAASRTAATTIVAGMVRVVDMALTIAPKHATGVWGGIPTLLSRHA